MASSAMQVDGKGQGKANKKMRTDDGDLSLRDLMEVMNNMQSSVNDGFQTLRDAQREMQDRMLTMASEFRSFKDEAAKKWEEFDGKLSAQDEKLTARMEKIEAEMKKGGSVDPWASFVKPATAAAPPSSVAMSSAGGGGFAESDVGDSHYDPKKVWVKGFGRPIMRARLLSHYDEIVKSLPESTKNNIERHLIRGPAAVYAIVFKTEEAAKDAYQFLRAADLTWEDGVSGCAVEIKIYRDQKLEDRNANRVIGKLWAPVTEMIKEAGMWNGTMRLMNYNRQLWVIDNEEPYPLVRIQVQGSRQLAASVLERNAEHYKIQGEKLQCLVTAAVAPRL